MYELERCYENVYKECGHFSVIRKIVGEYLVKRIIITGFSGFVARHFVEYLGSLDESFEVLGIDINDPQYDFRDSSANVSVEFVKVNMLDADELHKVFKEFMPEYVLHLAAFSSVAYSWKHPAESFLNNSNIFLNLIEAIKENNPQCRVLSVGSSEEYGKVSNEDVPLKESQPLHPLSPYAVARVSQEQLSKVFAESFNLNIVLTRSFNHIGPRQDQRFVVPSFIRRILDIKESGADSGTIETGDISIVRDFVDVRDVVRAYYMLLMEGRSGEVYNICSGRPLELKRLIEIIGKLVGVDVKTITNPEFVRPNDNPVIVGSPYKIESEIGWYPEISMKKTIEDMITYMEG